MPVMQNLNKACGGLSDSELRALCVKYGGRALKWRRKFMGLLPEVYRRKLYCEEKYSYSIFVFSKKLGGLSEEQTRRVLNLEKKFTIMPVLRDMLIESEVSVNKLARVASVATPENQEFWARQARVLPKSALETLIRDNKIVACEKSVPGHGLASEKAAMGIDAGVILNMPVGHLGATDAANKPEVGDNGACAGGAELFLSPEVCAKLLELQRKGIDI